METKRTARQSRLPAPAGGTVSRRTASSTTESKGTAGKTAPKSTSGGASQGSASSSMWGKTGSVSFPELKRQHAALAEEHEKLVEKHQKLKEHARKESRKSTKRVEQLEAETQQQQTTIAELQKQNTDLEESFSKKLQEVTDECHRKEKLCEESVVDMKTKHFDETGDLQNKISKQTERIRALEAALEKCGVDPVSLLPFGELCEDKDDRSALLQRLDAIRESIHSKKLILQGKLTSSNDATATVSM